MHRLLFNFKTIYLLLFTIALGYFVYDSYVSIKGQEVRLNVHVEQTSSNNQPPQDISHYTIKEQLRRLSFYQKDLVKNYQQLASTISSDLDNEPNRYVVEHMKAVELQIQTIEGKSKRTQQLLRDYHQSRRSKEQADHQKVSDALHEKVTEEMQGLLAYLDSFYTVDRSINRQWEAYVGDMVVVNSGTALIGCSKWDNECSEQERPAKNTTFEKFAIMATEVTYGQWLACVKAEMCRDIGNEKTLFGWEDTSNKPVLNITWPEAKAFAAWVSLETGQMFDLPTSAEWEYVARAGSPSKFSWREDVQRNYKTEARDKHDYHHGWVKLSELNDVAVLAPNQWGVYDMNGSLREMTNDCAAIGQDKIKGQTVAQVENCTAVIVRGRSSSFNFVDTRASELYQQDLHSSHKYTGFRLITRDVN